MTKAIVILVITFLISFSYAHANDDKFSKDIIGTWIWSYHKDNYNTHSETNYLSNGKYIQQIKNNHSIIRKDGNFTISNQPSSFKNEGTWYIKNGILFLDTEKSNHPNFKFHMETKYQIEYILDYKMKLRRDGLPRPFIFERKISD